MLVGVGSQLRDAQNAPPPGDTVDVAEALDAAMLAALPALSPHTGAQVMAGVRSADLSVKARRMRLATLNLVRDRLDDESLAAWDHGVLVWSVAQDAHDAGRGWLARVTLPG